MLINYLKVRKEILEKELKTKQDKLDHNMISICLLYTSKAEKRKAKQGIYRDKVLEASKSSTRSFSNNSTMTEAEREEKIAKAKANVKQGSMASKVNMVKDYNERNKK